MGLMPRLVSKVSHSTRLTTRLTLLLWSSLSTLSHSMTIIDSHLHVWASPSEQSAFPWAAGQEPPESLQSEASTAKLIQQMDIAKVDGALIVQPINHKFDHSYVADAMKHFPKRFKGMMLHDPSLSSEEAVSALENLVLKGFVGVRFNPYLWPKEGDGWMPMSKGAGLAVYRRCGELQVPVGVMCFQGLQLHYDDIVELLNQSPKTELLLDHFAFTSLTEDGDAAFQKLLKLASYPQVSVKISALFRLQDASPYERIRKERFEPLLAAFGAGRLCFGTDFPFVQEVKPEGYAGMLEVVTGWLKNPADKKAVLGGTATRLFGPWE